jgi:hypothetical protein
MIPDTACYNCGKETNTATRAYFFGCNCYKNLCVACQNLNREKLSLQHNQESHKRVEVL